MELKELTKKITDIMGCLNKDFPKALNDIIFSSKRNDFYEKYINLCPDLSEDWLQRIYQFYNADRQEKKQDFTPISLSRLLAFLTYIPNRHTVYDSCAGSGSLVIQQWVLNKDIEFICEELDENVLPLLLFNISIRNINATVLHKNVLTGEVYGIYKLRQNSRYSDIERELFNDAKEYKCECAISNPPFNLPISNNIRQELINMFPGKWSVNFAFVIDSLIKTERLLAVILPTGCLTSKQEVDCRQYLCEQGYLQAVISLPNKMFEQTDVNTCILFFDKKKTNKNVFLIDATHLSTKHIREQRGEGSASHYNRIYKRVFNKFTETQITSICELCYKELEDFSKRVSLDDLKAHNYQLIIGPYQDIKFEGTIHRDFNEIIKDINRIIRERNVIKVTVNKVWGERLGLNKIINDCLANNQIVHSINECLENFKNYKVKEKLIENKYIQSSNSKVFVIENTDKERLSSIMPFFMNMYKQHIYYLNEEENRLLSELRDSMLPFLMNGQLEIGTNKENEIKQEQS